MSTTEYEPLYRFDVVLHPRPAGAVAAGERADSFGTWSTLDVPKESLAEPFAVGFDDVLATLDRIPRLVTEPDGAILWASTAAGQAWQVDGTLAERDGRALAVELKGCCPAAAFDQVLQAFGWPRTPVMLQIVRSGVFLDESTFRRHAVARGIATSEIPGPG